MGFFIFGDMRSLFYLSTLLLFLSLFHKESHAQDTIFKKNGDMLYTRILEIRPNEISYKLISNPDGPIYLVSPKEIKLIRFSNGTKQLFESAESMDQDYARRRDLNRTKDGIPDLYNFPIHREGNLYDIGFINLPPLQVDRLLLQRSDKQINLMAKEARKNKRLSKLLTFATIPCGVGFYTGLIISSSVNSNYGNLAPTAYLISGTFAIAGIGSTVAAFVLNARSKKIRREAVDLYNRTYFE